MKKNVLFFICLFLVGVIRVNALTELSIPKGDGAYFKNFELRKISKDILLDSNYSFSDLSLLRDNIPDPSIIKSGDYYYLYSTACDGIHTYKSKNLRDWKRISNANTNDNKSKYNCFWAPEVYYYKKDNKYYMTYTIDVNDKNKSKKIMISSSDKPEGPFTDDKEIKTGVYAPIDSHIFFDDDGRIYLYFKDDKVNGKQVNGRGTTIYVEELDKNDLSKTITKAKAILTLKNDNYSKDRSIYWENSLVEAPYVIKNNGTYYLMYSVGVYDKDNYAISYATSKSPTGKFERKTIGDTAYGTVNAPLLHGSLASNMNKASTYNVDKLFYGTGHNSIIKISNDEMYIAYHRISDKSGKYPVRTIAFDQFGIDSKGNLYVNGPSKNAQPTPSGAYGLYKLESKKYDVSINEKKISSLKDGINYNAENSSRSISKTIGEKKTLFTVNKTQSKTLTINLKESKNVGNIWLYSDYNTFKDATCNVELNDKYIINNYNLHKSNVAKIQIPSVIEMVNKIKISCNKTIGFSEVSVYYKDDVKPSKIEVVENPTNTKYFQNMSTLQPFSLEGGKIKVYYSNGLSKIISMTDKGVTTSGFDDTTTGSKKVTVTYLGLNDSFYINVVKYNGYVAPEISGYVDPQIPGNNNDINIPPSGYVDPETPGYVDPELPSGSGVISTAPSNVNDIYYSNNGGNEVSIVNVEFVSKPTKLQFVINDSIDLSGGVVEIEKSDGTKNELELNTTNCTVEFDSTETGTKPVNINVNGFILTYYVEVNNSNGEEEEDYSFDAFDDTVVKYVESRESIILKIAIVSVLSLVIVIVGTIIIVRKIKKKNKKN